MKKQKTCEDFYDGKKWLQRRWVDNKYPWTVSGVIWNNIKERTTSNSSTQQREPTYIGSVNLFKSFDVFVEWHRKQVGYGMGYELDSDLLRKDVKVYSENTCLLIPGDLNRFLQGNGQRKYRENLPTGITLDRTKTKLVVRIGCLGSRVYESSQLEEAKAHFLEVKTRLKDKWIEWLINNKENIDSRVLKRMERLRFYHSEDLRVKWRII